MKLAFIISEYNPFHCGHEYMIRQIRKKLGDVTVIAIMSTSFVQRGEPALFPAEVRARAALECGADLVVSLPVPYSMSGSSFFARAGVRIAAAFSGYEKYLIFGSESGDINALEKIAVNMADTDFIRAVDERPKDEPYAESVVRIYGEMFDECDRELLSQPNNILALEYLRAIKDEGADLRPFTVKRVGSGYNDSSCEGEFLSATALRKLFLEGERELFYSKVPAAAAEIYRAAAENGDYSLGWYGLSEGAITFLRLSGEDAFSGCAEMSGGLDRRIVSTSHTTGNVEELFDLVATKRFTNARIRRALLSALLSVSESDIAAHPQYIMVLSANGNGTDVLRSVDTDRLSVITKPSSVDVRHRAGKLLVASEALYGMSLLKKRGSYDFMKITPYIKR